MPHIVKFIFSVFVLHNEPVGSTFTSEVERFSNSLTMSLYTGARPKTRSILSNKIINETENICIDKTVPVNLNISAPNHSSTPRTSLSPKRRLLNDLAVDRPTRSNKNYVPLTHFSDPETLF